MDFVRWGRPMNEPTTIAVLNAPSLYRELLSIAEAKRSSNREFRIIEIQATADLKGVDLVFFGTGTQTRWNELIDRAQLESIVTVSDQTGFMDAGGLIEFSIHKNRLRFSLNLESTETYGVDLSSKLIQLSAR
ncbi:YfiR family protein [Pelagicoccus albus]|uniref:YfiR family protein n=1 Tax=Pelagicoccus albus TaxID=415222 RepID=A0A7X1BC13_9BACT|nr:YfiR family protein [Pelagicoccus albus]